jgi:hypothetical protein
MAAPTPSKLDYGQVLQGSFDEATGALRVEGTFSGGSLDVMISSTTDSIAIGNASNGYQLLVNSDGSIDTRGQQMFTLPYDAITVTYPTSTRTVYVSRVGGINGTDQQTLTLNYTDATQTFLLNAAVTTP